MNILVIVEVFGDVHLFCMGTNKAEGRRGRFLHDVAELAGQSQTVVSFHLGRLNKE